MTIKTDRRFAVNSMALVAVERLAVSRRLRLHQTDNLIMTAGAEQAGILQRTHIETVGLRAVGSVTLLAARQREVIVMLLRVAVVAGRNLQLGGRMVFMTIAAAQVFLMRSTFVTENPGNLFMAICAIVAVHRTAEDWRHRLVMPVAGRTIGLLHLGVMALMALQTIGLIFVLYVASVTAHLSVSRVTLRKPGSRFSVARSTELGGQSLCFLGWHRYVRSMTAETGFFYRPVSMPGMTVAAVG